MGKNRLEAFSDGVIAIILLLFPFVTAWMGENHFASVPSALYGGVLLAAAIAYWLLQQAIIATPRWVWFAQALYVAAALLWLVPDRRIEGALRQHDG